MKKVNHQEFLDEGKRLYGDNTLKWKFKCPACSYVQSAQDFLDNGVSKEVTQGQIAFSCIGRSVKGIGCDWTLGGFLQIQNKMVDENPIFEFADETTKEPTEI